MFEPKALFSLQSMPLIAAGLLFGLSAALIVWLVTKSVTEVPEDDRTYLDPPPFGFQTGLVSYSLGGIFNSTLDQGKTKTGAGR